MRKAISGACLLHWESYIFCDKCDAYFELYLLKKSIIIFGNLSKYLAVIVLVSAVVYGFFLFDGTIHGGERSANGINYIK